MFHLDACAYHEIGKKGVLGQDSDKIKERSTSSMPSKESESQTKQIRFFATFKDWPNDLILTAFGQISSSALTSAQIMAIDGIRQLSRLESI